MGSCFKCMEKTNSRHIDIEYLTTGVAVMFIDHRQEAISGSISVRTGPLLWQRTKAAINESLPEPDPEIDVIVTTTKTECLLLLLLHRAGITQARILNAGISCDGRLSVTTTTGAAGRGAGAARLGN